jgi:hypothetical protein
VRHQRGNPRQTTTQHETQHRNISVRTQALRQPPDLIRVPADRRSFNGVDQIPTTLLGNPIGGSTSPYTEYEVAKPVSATQVGVALAFLQPRLGPRYEPTVDLTLCRAAAWSASPSEEGNES